MADESQPLQPDPVISTGSTPPAAKPRWPTSRIILLLVLAGTIGLWAFDFFSGNRSQKHAYDLLNAKLAADDAEKTEPGKASIGRRVELLSPEDVHKLLGRDPDATETSPAELRQYMLNDKEDKDPKAARPLDPPAMVEVYSYRGAFRSYRLRVAYAKSPVAKNGPAYIMTGLKKSKE